MSDPDITMEKYIQLEAEKSRRPEFLAIVYRDALTSEPEISSEPTVTPNHVNFEISFSESDDEDYTFIYVKDSFSYKLISVNDVKFDKDNNDDEIDVEPFSEIISIKLLDSVIDADVDTYSHEFDENLEMNHDILAERHLWLRYEDQEYTDDDIHDFEDRLGRIYDRRVHRIHVLDFEELTEEMDQALTDRLRIDHTGAGQMSWREFIMALALHTAEEIDTEGFIAYWDESSRMGEIKHLRRYADGRKQGAKMSRGYFIARLAEHFRLITIESLQGLTVVVCDLTMIDMDELVRLHICERLL
ncbi:hypothetical protein Tco_0836500, partial [Tanacetum coccineum]